MKELLEDRSNWANPGFKSAIVDYVKPAFIIDGQHRIAAAARIGINGLPFMICGLYDAPWEEQVFQFTVVNLRPKRIPPSLITSIAGLSLTRNEQDKVEQRLKQAGVEVVEVAIMSLVAYDDASPFAEKVDMQVSGPKAREDKLGYGTVKRITKEWYNANRTSLTQIAKEAYEANSVSVGQGTGGKMRGFGSYFSALFAVQSATTIPLIFGRKRLKIDCSSGRICGHFRK